MEKSSYRISNIYQGGYSSFVPPSNNYSNNMAAGSFGMTTDPRNANILQEVSSKLSSGVKQVEIEGVNMEMFDSIPKQHLREVNRLSKLTGVDISLHGPVIDTAGFTQNGFSEIDRELAERKVTETLLRSHELNPDGNIPVNFHSAEGIPGSQFLPPGKRKVGKNGEEENYRKIIAVNRESGRMAPAEPEEKYYPGGENGEIRKVIYTPEKSLEFMNRSEWDNSISQIEFNRQRISEIAKDVDPVTAEVYLKWRLAQEHPEVELSQEVKDELKSLNQEQWNQIQKMHSASAYAEQAMKSANAAFSKAWETINSEKTFTPEEEMDKQRRIENLKEVSKKYSEILGPEEKGKVNLNIYDPQAQSQALFTLISGLEKAPPKVWVPIEEFALEKSSKTYGNSAWNAYKKFKDKSPVLVIENPPAGFALSSGEDIANIVKASRKQFVENAMKPTEQGGMNMSEKEATKQAEKFIGATWDVGHINMMRKYGYEEKDIIAESAKVAPFIKHVHLSDNFGFEHTELPMGMGNVPLKEIMEKLGEKGFEARKIIEAGHWWNHFKTPPFQEVLENVGSPLYSMKMAPYWSQAPGNFQGYLGGLDGQWLPQTNYETFGTSFARLPSELGGARPGAQGSRMSGRGME